MKVNTYHPRALFALAKLRRPSCRVTARLFRARALVIRSLATRVIAVTRRTGEIKGKKKISGSPRRLHARGRHQRRVAAHRVPECRTHEGGKVAAAAKNCVWQLNL